MKFFNSKTLLAANALALTLLAGTIAWAQHPNVSGARHPNLNAAQRFIEQANEKISAAQQANEFDMKGHAAKAKNLVEEAFREIKLAAEAANHR
jgi:outer membrane murein-binding lipoprotein Lpp